VSLACRKAKELGYLHELRTTRLLARHAREHGPAEGRACLDKVVQGTVCKIFDEQGVKPHKVRYYLERRDPGTRLSFASATTWRRSSTPLRRGHNAELCKMRANRIDHRGLLADEQIACAVPRQAALLLRRLSRNEPHIGPGDRYAYGLGVGFT
jgi:hypothetical protein